MPKQAKQTEHDFKGIGFSKIGYFKEVRSKIKELEQLNFELAGRHNKLEAVINSMNSGLTILDRDLKIVYANRVQIAMFPEASLVGRHCHEAFFRKKGACRDCPARKTFDTRETFRGEILVKDGAFAGRYYEWTTSPIKDHFGEVSEIVLLMRNITRRKEAEFKLLQADRMAAIGFLAASIAHEINNPLTSIAGFSEGLLKRLKDFGDPGRTQGLESAREYLEIIFKEAYRCKDVIQRLVEYSRKSADTWEALEIDEIIKDTVSLVRQHAKDNRITLVFKNGLSVGFNRIAGNESQLKHLFLGIFNSTFKTMKRGGRLTIVARNRGNLIRIVIENRSSKAAAKWTKTQTEGSCSQGPDPTEAMDLSVCYSIMRLHAGDLQLQAGDGDDSSVTLTFPVVTAP